MLVISLTFQSFQELKFLYIQLFLLKLTISRKMLAVFSVQNIKSSIAMFQLLISSNLKASFSHALQVSAYVFLSFKHVQLSLEFGIQQEDLQPILIFIKLKQHSFQFQSKFFLSTIKLSEHFIYYPIIFAYFIIQSLCLKQILL